eukprot:Rmarinus@m.7743
MAISFIPGVTAAGIGTSSVGAGSLRLAGVIIKAFVDIRAGEPITGVTSIAGTGIVANGVNTLTVHRALVGLQLALIVVSAGKPITGETFVAVALITTSNVGAGGIAAAAMAASFTLVDVDARHTITGIAVVAGAGEGGLLVGARSRRVAVVSARGALVDVGARVPITAVTAVAGALIVTRDVRAGRVEIARVGLGVVAFVNIFAVFIAVTLETRVTVALKGADSVVAAGVLRACTLGVAFVEVFAVNTVTDVTTGAGARKAPLGVRAPGTLRAVIQGLIIALIHIFTVVAIALPARRARTVEASFSVVADSLVVAADAFRTFIDVSADEAIALVTVVASARVATRIVRAVPIEGTVVVSISTLVNVVASGAGKVVARRAGHAPVLKALLTLVGVPSLLLLILAPRRKIVAVLA